MNSPDPDGAAALDVRDPDHDPTASYALDPARVRQLTGLVRSTSGESKRSVSPVNGQPLGDIPQSSEDDVAEAFRRARKAQRAWARTSFEERAAAMMRLHDLVLDRQEEILDLTCWESGKARKHAYEELVHVALTARYYARTAREHLTTRRVPGLVPALTQVEVNRVPKGVVGIIAPWNYPFTLALCDGLAAVMAGNAVVSKPDSQTPLTALIGVELMREAGVPDDVWQVVAGRGSVRRHRDHRARRLHLLHRLDRDRQDHRPAVR